MTIRNTFLAHAEFEWSLIPSSGPWRSGPSLDRPVYPGIGSKSIFIEKSDILKKIAIFSRIVNLKNTSEEPVTRSFRVSCTGQLLHSPWISDLILIDIKILGTGSYYD